MDSPDVARAAASASPAPSRASADEGLILARWILGLRWAVFGLLTVTLPLGERLFDTHVSYAIALTAIGVAVGKDLVLRRRPTTPRIVALGVALDLVAMAVVLAASGGAANPMSALFFVHVALAASLLPPRTTFLLAGLAAASFGALFLLPATGACCAKPPELGAFSAHLYGMLLAFVLCAGLVSFFLTRVRRALADRAIEIADLRRRAEESTRFAALGTLAAGTAHELATPLGTIAVLAGDIGEGSPEQVRAAGASILAQVSRCRDVITKMQGAARPAHERGSADLVDAALRAVDTWRAAHPEAQIDVRTPEGRELRVALAPSEIESALCALLDNAHHATLRTGSPAPIAVEVRGNADDARVEVEDRGTGLAPDLAGRLGEPFLTTKQPGEGMGLGLYLVRRLLEEAGGHLEVSARPQGTRVSIHLPSIHLPSPAISS